VAMPLIDRLSGLYEKLSFLWAVLWASNMPKMLWRPGTPLGELTTLPRPLTQGRTEGGPRGHAPPNHE